MISNNIHEIERVGKGGKYLLRIKNKSTGFEKVIEFKSHEDSEAIIDLIFNKD